MAEPPITTPDKRPLWLRYVALVFAESRRELERADLLNYVKTLLFPSGFTILAIVGVSTGTLAIPAVIAAVLGWLGLLVLWLVVVPSRVWDEQSKRIGVLENERKVRLVVRPGKLPGLPLRQEGLVLNLDAEGLDQVEDCTVRVEELLWDAGTYTVNGVEQPRIWKAMYVNEDIYLHFHNKDAAQAKHTFKGKATALVAWRGTEDIGRYFRLGSVGGKTYLLQSGISFLVVDVGAKNTAYQTCVFKLDVPGGTYGEITMEKIDPQQKPVATL